VRSNGPITKVNMRELVITRIFDMPRELVWKIWTDPEYIRRWWGPKGFTPPLCKNDFQIGGRYLYCTRSPDGRDCWNTGVYYEIVPFERIVYTELFCDSEGNPVSATNFGLSPDFPLETMLTVTFENLNGKTKLTLCQVDIPRSTDRETVKYLWNKSFDRLSESHAYP
jgi:uncharacterized protein YndB with AHSA1/START domain